MVSQICKLNEMELFEIRLFRSSFDRAGNIDWICDTFQHHGTNHMNQLSYLAEISD